MALQIGDKIAETWGMDQNGRPVTAGQSRGGNRANIRENGSR
ncbi:hypothetical protein [Proteiniphilum sp. X52]|nr:hypothetical protein [Proteiniphilum sp. X52]